MQFKETLSNHNIFYPLNEVYKMKPLTTIHFSFIITICIYYREILLSSAQHDHRQRIQNYSVTKLEQ